MLRIAAIPVVILSLLLTACQTSMLKQFEQVKPGMEKDDVLTLMGSPRQTQRFHGKDRWYYVFYDERIRFEKEIQFFEGNVIYIGNKWEPSEERSAVAMDAANDLKEREWEEQAALAVEKHRKDYEEYQKSVSGNDGKIRYLPRFEPIR